MRLKLLSWYEFKVPVIRSAYAFPSEFELPLLNSRKPLVYLCAGCAWRLHPQTRRAFPAWVRPPLVIVSPMLGMYLLPYRPADGPPASKPPGLNTRAASPPPHPPNAGI